MGVCSAGCDELTVPFRRCWLCSHSLRMLQKIVAVPSYSFLAVETCPWVTPFFPWQLTMKTRKVFLHSTRGIEELSHIIKSGLTFPLFLSQIICIYLKSKSDGFSSCWFIIQMSVTSGVGLGQARNQGLDSGLPWGWQGPQVLGMASGYALCALSGSQKQ